MIDYKYKDDTDEDKLYFICGDRCKLEAYEHGVRDAMAKSRGEIEDKIKWMKEKFKENEEVNRKEFEKAMEESAKNPHKHCDHFHNSPGW
jgi:hypothetical protein